MARQFRKLLGTGSRPDVYLGEPGNPDIVARPTYGGSQQPDLGGKIKEGEVLPAIAAAKSEQGKAKRERIRVKLGKERKRQEAGLATTTMRLDEGSGEVYDLEDQPKVTPRPATPPAVIVGRYPGKPNTSAQPADWPKQFEQNAAAEKERAAAAGQSAIVDPAGQAAKVAAKAEEISKADAERIDMQKGEAEFNVREKAAGSYLRSVNGVTFDVRDREEETQKGAPSTWQAQTEKWNKYVEENRIIPKAPEKPKPEGDKETPTSSESSLGPDSDIKDVEKVFGRDEEGKLAGGIFPGGARAAGTEGPKEEPADIAMREGARLAEKRERERPRVRRRFRSNVVAGGEPVVAKPSEVVGSKPDLEYPKAYVETTLSDDAQDMIADIYKDKDPDAATTTMREIRAEGPAKKVGEFPVRTSQQLAPYVKPDVEDPAAGRRVPGMAIDTFANQETDIAQQQAELDRARKNRISPTATTVADLGKQPSRAQRGRSEEQALTDISQANERNARLEEEGRGFKTHSDEVLQTAKRMAIRSGMSREYYEHPLFNQHEHVTKAYVMHGTGTQNDESKLDAYLGGRPLEASSRLKEAYKLLNQKERFTKSSAPGTGYTYSQAQGNLNPETDHFVTSKGEYLPMSTQHPENPLNSGKPLEGSHVPFNGFYKRPDGTYSRVEVHQGWHRYNRNIGTKKDPKYASVFEYHDVPKDAIHAADVLSSAIRGGTTTQDIMRKITSGVDSPVTLEGQNITPAKGSVAERAKIRKKADKKKKKSEPLLDSKPATSATTTLPLASTGRVAVSNLIKNEKGEVVGRTEPKIREFTEVEAINASRVPKSDDSKKLIASVGAEPRGVNASEIFGEKKPTELLPEEKDKD